MQFICIRAQCAPLLFKLASPSRCSSYSVSLGSCCCHATTQNQFKVSLCPFSWSWSIFNVKHRSAVWRARYLPAPGAGDARLQSLQFQPGRIWINKHKLWGISYRIRPPLKKDIPFTVCSRPSLNKICISLFSAALFLFLSPVFIRKQSINKTSFCCLARLDWKGVLFIWNAAYCWAGLLQLPRTCRQTESGQVRWSNLCSSCSPNESWSESSASDLHLETKIEGFFVCRETQFESVYRSIFALLNQNHRVVSVCGHRSVVATLKVKVIVVNILGNVPIFCLCRVQSPLATWKNVQIN